MLSSVDRRGVTSRINVTANPTAEWIARQITEAFPWDDAPQHLIRDRDRIYGTIVTRRLRAMSTAWRVARFVSARRKARALQCDPDIVDIVHGIMFGVGCPHREERRQGGVGARIRRKLGKQRLMIQFREYQQAIVLEQILVRRGIVVDRGLMPDDQRVG